MASDVVAGDDGHALAAVGVVGEQNTVWVALVVAVHGGVSDHLFDLGCGDAAAGVVEVVLVPLDAVEDHSHPSLMAMVSVLHVHVIATRHLVVPSGSTLRSRGWTAGCV